MGTSTNYITSFNSFLYVDQRVYAWEITDLNNVKPGLINLKRLFNWGVPFQYWIMTLGGFIPWHPINMVLLYMVCHGSHQHSPWNDVSIYISAPWIRHGLRNINNQYNKHVTFINIHNHDIIYRNYMTWQIFLHMEMKHLLPLYHS